MVLCIVMGQALDSFQVAEVDQRVSVFLALSRAGFLSIPCDSTAAYL